MVPRCKNLQGPDAGKEPESYRAGNQAMTKCASYPGAARTYRERGTVCNSHKRPKERPGCMVPSKKLFAYFFSEKVGG